MGLQPVWSLEICEHWKGSRCMYAPMKVTSWTRLFQKLTSGRRFCSALIKNTRNPTETQGNTGKSDTGGGHSAHHACAPHQLHTHLSTPDQNKKLQNTFFKIQYFCVCFFFCSFCIFSFFSSRGGGMGLGKKTRNINHTTPLGETLTNNTLYTCTQSPTNAQTTKKSFQHPFTPLFTKLTGTYLIPIWTYLLFLLPLPFQWDHFTH